MKSLIFASSLLMISLAAPASKPSSIAWRELPELPQALGGQFVGTIGDTLVVAGGSYFTRPPWEGGRKIWVDTIYRLDRDANHWRLAGHLPTQLGYGASVSTGDALLIAGGQNGVTASSETFQLTIRGGRLVIEKLASLPKAASMVAGALLSGNMYIAGGQGDPASVQALNGFSFFSGNLWRSVATWPGPPRILPLMAALDGYLYLVSGAELTGEQGPPLGRRFLTDGFRFKPGSGWEKLPGLANAVQAGSAIGWKGKLLVFGGNDGVLADRELELKDRHPGFRKDVLAFDPENMRWSIIGEMPYSLVTTGITTWGNEFVIAGGEIRPAHRSAKVIAGHIL